MSYALDGRDSELKDHVGQRVEIMGTLDASHDSSTAGATSTSTTTSGSASSRMDMTKRLKVSSVRMIASTCSAK